MSTQSEAALEAGLITTLQQMDYEYVQIVEEDNCMPISSGSWRFITANGWRNMDAMSLRQKSLRRFSYTLKVVLALKRQRNSVIYIRLIRLMDSVYGWNF